MSDQTHIHGRALSDAEMKQLKELLVRYVGYQAAGLMNFAIEKLIKQIWADEMPDHALVLPEIESPKRKRGSRKIIAAQ